MARFRSLLLAAALFATGQSGAIAAEAPAVLTIVDGQALIYRADVRVHAIEGARLTIGDIVETAAGTFAQLELSDQSVLQLGPQTRIMLDGTSSDRKLERWVYLMQGWAKVSGSRRDAKTEGQGAAKFDLRSPLLDMAANPGVVVLKAMPGETALFVERGEAIVQERVQGRPNAARAVVARPVVRTLRAGDFYLRKGPTEGQVNANGPHEFVAAMPRHFRDSLPQRIAQFRAADPALKPAPDFSYDDVQPWLQAESSVRRQFVRRWRAKIRNAAFRSALIANLSAHPEWDPLLFPEKYLPKESPPTLKQAAQASNTPRSVPVSPPQTRPQ